jgi:hypothetical protein
MSENELRFLNCIAANGHGKPSKRIEVNVVNGCHQCSSTILASTISTFLSLACRVFRASARAPGLNGQSHGDDVVRLMPLVPIFLNVAGF